MDHGSIEQVAAHFAHDRDGVVSASHSVHPNHHRVNDLVADGAVVVLLVPSPEGRPLPARPSVLGVAVAGTATPNASQ